MGAGPLFSRIAERVAPPGAAAAAPDSLVSEPATEEDNVPDPRRRRSVSQTHLDDLLSAQLAAWSGDHPGRDVVDLGGGTGGMAMDLGANGYRVRVVDPSPDALAALERRTAERGLAEQVTAVQGDATELVDLIGAESADLVVCHKVLEVVDDPAEALAAIGQVLRPGGALSLMVAQRHAAVLTQALAGHIAQARRIWNDPARFDRERVLAAVSAAGLGIRATHGVGTVAGHVAESALDAASGAHAELLELETEVATDPAFQALAPLLHVFAVKP
jgi:SAM-dependent methyltransferase